MNQRTLSLALTYLLTNIPSSTPFTTPRHHHAATIKTTTSTPFVSSPTTLFGILDEVNSDAFQLGKTDTSSPSNADLSKAYEIFLAELVFSPNDPRVDIVENAELAFDPSFILWLDTKVKKCTDPEEKLALRDLHDMILDTKEKLALSEAAAARQATEAAAAEAVRIAAAEAAATEGAGLSDADVLRRASLVDNAAVEKEREDIAAKQQGTKQTFYDAAITPEIRASYDKLLQKLLPPYAPGETPASVVYNDYEQFDAQLVKVLNERRDGGDRDVAVLLDALAAEQQKRVAEAMEKLQSVLKLGEPMRMEGAIVKMAKENRIDEAFLLLLEANADQAQAAGATGPAALMRRLRSRALDEKDKQASSKEIRLLRKLLRAETSQEREDLLTEAFTPKEALIVPGTMENAQKAVDGEAQEQEKPMPEVPPPDFINACKAVLLNFGNLDDGKGDMASRIKLIASEAEVVATRIFGKGMTPKEQQDRMWKDETTSIFDLETMEIEAERMGEKAPWATKPIEDEILPGFDADGRMTIGGN